MSFGRCLVLMIAGAALGTADRAAATDLADYSPAGAKQVVVIDAARFRATQAAKLLSANRSFSDE